MMRELYFSVPAKNLLRTCKKRQEKMMLIDEAGGGAGAFDGTDYYPVVPQQMSVSGGDGGGDGAASAEHVKHVLMQAAVTQPQQLVQPQPQPVQPQAPPAAWSSPLMHHGYTGQVMHQLQRVPQEPGYLELLWQRRRDVLKLIMLSITILLAISLHSTAWHYLRSFIEDTTLTWNQELVIRLAYPIVVLVVLWHVKAFLLPPR